VVNHAASRTARQLRELLSAMTATADVMSPRAPRDAAAEWLGRRRRYVDESIDPLGKPLAMPAIRRPTWEERMSLENAFVRKLECEKADARGAPK
jgi:hypothetical protein